jgi:hypothetical protein
MGLAARSEFDATGSYRGHGFRESASPLSLEPAGRFSQPIVAGGTV